MSETPPLLNDAGLAALDKTRPWMYLIGICSILFSFIALLALIGGLLGVSANPERAHLIMVAGITALIISLPSAIVQMGYAFALSRVNEASNPELGVAVELACVRQRNLWVVNGLTVGLLAVMLISATVKAIIR